METRIDFIEWLQSDLALCIMKRLDDPSDLIRASSVSHSWRNFVILNGLFELLCKIMYPQLGQITEVIELQDQRTSIRSVGVGSSDLELENLERCHKAYGSLYEGITVLRTARNCLAGAISASSTDNYPEESIINTLHPGNIVLDRASYWSSTGQSDPKAPETLIYRLKSNLCAITEINIQPFEAYFQPGAPIYAPKSVRFRMGYPKSTSEMEGVMRPLQDPADDKFVWTICSQEFPVTHDNKMQSFKFPDPFVCIGGYLQIELLGRFQKQELDGLFYICISQVQVKGRRLAPAFVADVIEPGKFSLKFSPERFEDMLDDDQYDPFPNRLLPFQVPAFMQIPRNII